MELRQQIVEQHKIAGDTIKIREEKCGCLVVYARNINIYGGSDTFTYSCYQCKYKDHITRKKQKKKDYEAQISQLDQEFEAWKNKWRPHQSDIPN